MERIELTRKDVIGFGNLLVAEVYSPNGALIERLGIKTYTLDNWESDKETPDAGEKKPDAGEKKPAKRRRRKE